MSDHWQHDRKEIEFCKDRLNIEFNNLCYYPPGKKVKSSNQKPILKNICGKFHSGHLIAIVGPSGAGKTSLLNVLAGFKTNGVTGSIEINGRQRNVQKFRKQSSYITQEFAILELLTTRETMVVAADLKLDSDVGKEMKNGMINKILNLLGLEKAIDTPVAKLSGGEKKRLSIGLELLTNPPVMFFDEPTSGLDSSSALQVISHLKSLAKGGRTVLCSIHQPSSRLFQMFDDIYVVAKGQCLYGGPVGDLTSVFEEAGFQCPSFYNRADFVIEVACGERGDNIDKLIEKFNHKEGDPMECRQNADSEETSMLHPTTPKENDTAIQIYTENEVYARTSYPQSTWKQFQVLLKRSLLCSLRDKLAVQLRIICHLVVGLLLGALYYDAGNDAAKVLSNVACVFFFMLFLVFANGVPCVISIPLETSVVLREHLNNWYSLKAYYCSKMIADIPLQILCPTVFLLVGYFLTDQPSDGTRFLQFWVICLLMTVIAQNLGLATGAFFLNPQVAMFVVPAANIPLVLFSGFFLNLRDVPSWLKWLTHISYFRYAFEGSMQCVYGYNRSNMECSQPYCYFKSPLKFLEEFEMADAVYAYDIGALVIWVVVLQLLVLIVLKARIRSLQ